MDIQKPWHGNRKYADPGEGRRRANQKYNKGEKAQTYRKKRYLNGAAAVHAWKEQHTFRCMDCSRTYHPFQLQADHRPGTFKKVSASRKAMAMQWSQKTILAELAKCDCVCANCHTLRTYVRGWRRQTGIYSQKKGSKHDR